jgi:hypothetical protein
MTPQQQKQPSLGRGASPFWNNKISSACSIIWLKLIGSYKYTPLLQEVCVGMASLDLLWKDWALSPSRANKNSSSSLTTFLGSGNDRSSYKKHLPNLRRG